MLRHDDMFDHTELFYLLKFQLKDQFPKFTNAEARAQTRERLAPHHTARKWQNQSRNPGLLTPRHAAAKQTAVQTGFGMLA